MPFASKRRLPLFYLSSLQAPTARVISQSDAVAKDAIALACLMPFASKRAPSAFLFLRCSEFYAKLSQVLAVGDAHTVGNE